MVKYFISYVFKQNDGDNVFGNITLDLSNGFDVEFIQSQLDKQFPKHNCVILYFREIQK